MLACQMEYMPQEDWSKDPEKDPGRNAEEELRETLRAIRTHPPLPGISSEDSPGHYSAPLPERPPDLFDILGALWNG